jgi:hypothetical protein
MKRNLLLSFGIFLLAGCGSMQVQVSVLRPQIVEAELDRISLRDGLPTINALTPAAIDDQYTALKNLHAGVLARLADSYDLAAPAKPKPSTWHMAATLLRGEVTKTIADQYDQEKAAISALVARIQGLSADPAQQTALMRQYNARRQDFRRLIGRGMAQTIKKAQSDEIPLTPGVDLAVEVFQQREEKTIIGDANITRNRLAFVVSNAEREDKTAWAPVFDRSYGVGRLGRMDMAIKMETRGVFTIKGLSFDPSQVARVASKAAAQALTIAAQISGVPLSAGTFTGDGAALATSSGKLTTLQDETTKAEAKLDDKKSALLELASQVIARRVDFESAETTQARLRDAIGAIGAKFDSTKQRLNAQ